MGDQVSSGGGSIFVAKDNGTVAVYSLHHDIYKDIKELIAKVTLTETALNNFFQNMEQETVSYEKLDSKLREISDRYKDLKANLESIQESFKKHCGDMESTGHIINNFFNAIEHKRCADEELDRNLQEIANEYNRLKHLSKIHQADDAKVIQIKAQVKHLIENGDYQKARDLLRQAEFLDLKHHLDEINEAKHLLSAVTTKIDRANLERNQLRYAESARLFEQAAKLLPKDKKKEQAEYLYNAGIDFDRVNLDADALRLLETSLIIQQEIGDLTGEAATCWNIGIIYKKQGDLKKAEQYMNHTVSLERKISLPDYNEHFKELHGIRWHIFLERMNFSSLRLISMNNHQTYKKETFKKMAYFDLLTLRYVDIFKQAAELIELLPEDRRKEQAVYLNSAGLNLLRIHRHADALLCFQESLMICRNINDQNMEAEICWNIGCIYKKEGELIKAGQYIRRTLQLRKDIGFPNEAIRNELQEIHYDLFGKSIFNRIKIFLIRKVEERRDIKAELKKR